MNNSAYTENEDRPKVWLHPPTVMISAMIGGYILRCFLGGLLGFVPQALAEGLGGIMMIGSVSVLIAAVTAFAAHDEELKPATPTRTLLTMGPYRYSRNPIYLALVLFGAGFGVATLNLWIILGASLAGFVYHFLVILPEEAYLAKQFGAEYEKYKRLARRWL